MSTISAKIILDSVNVNGVRLTTVHMRYWRAIHSEALTHRLWARNARSSRAVPVQKMLDECIEDPFIPLFWGKNQAGMQAGVEINEPVCGVSREEAWLQARDQALFWAEEYMKSGYHKQLVNRLLEPFIHIDTLVSATDWNNFFYLRDHKDAEPHIELLAKQVKKAMESSKPKTLLIGQWHLPYITTEEIQTYDIQTLKKISAARCARISYQPFDGNASVEKEIERFEKLAGDPVHASPMEHIATPNFDNPKSWGNFREWKQFRKEIPNESIFG